MSPEQTVIDAELIPTVGTDVIRYHPDEAALAELRLKYTGMDAVTDYDGTRLAIRELISCRSQVEATRQARNRNLIDRQRANNGQAAKITDSLTAIEKPLRESKEKVDAENERLAREIVEAEQARLAAIEQAAKDAEEARLKAIRDAEQAALAAERAYLAKEREAARAERAKLDAERAARQEDEDLERRAREAVMEGERRRLREFREKLEAEQAAVKAEQERLERIEWERQANERAQKEAAARAQEAMERAAREQQAKWELECAAAEAEKVAELQRQSEMEIVVKRIEEARPDVEKIRGIAKTMLKSIVLPSVKNETAKVFLAQFKADLEALANRCLAFKVTNGKKGQS